MRCPMLLASPVGLSKRNCAAASSMARGSPSSLAQTAATADALYVKEAGEIVGKRVELYRAKMPVRE